MTQEKAKQSKAKPLQVVVTSDKMNKSRVGEFTSLVQHPTYKKYMKRRTKLMFHDENNTSKLGDEVLVKPDRPRSARKKFVLVKVIGQSKRILNTEEKA